ncbi:MAG: YbhB/YbcL family Raf kinase inhibitor-like protein [Micavibrio sp.]
MYSKVIKILILAVGIAVLVAALAFTMMKPDPAAVPPVAKVQKQYPHRDMLQDTVVAAPESSPAPQSAPEPAVAVAPPPVQRPVETPPAQPEKLTLQLDNLAGTLKISSPALKPGGRIPLEHSCYRKNKSPPLGWADAPRGTKNLVVFFESVDAVGGDRLQWAVYNIPVTTTALAGALPKEPLLPDGLAQALNDGGNIGYIGPCKPKGEQPYRLRVFALDTALDLPGALKKDDLIRAMNGHIIDMAVLNLVHYYRL